jgi:hypothetical protein
MIVSKVRWYAQGTGVSIHGVAGLGPKPVHHETPVTAPDSSVS